MLPAATISRRAGAALLASALAFALATSARADDRFATSGRADDRVTPETSSSWYGWQTLLSDAGATGLWVLAATLNDAKYTSGSLQTYQEMSNVTLALGLATYALGAPAVHLLHDQRQEAGVSFALRLGLPLAGGLAGGLIANASCSPGQDDEVPCAIVGGVIGVLAGGATAMLIDAVVLAREPAGRAAERRVQPVFVPGPGGGTFLLAGRF
jgi:hypothetical protein